jgi:putative ABC transport system permease protein
MWGGLLLARGLVVFMSSFTGQPIEQVSATPETMLRAFAVGVIVTIIAALAPAWQASRISPLQALRIQGSVDESRWLYTGLKFGPLTVVAALLVLYYVPFRQEIAFLVGSNSIFVLLLGATLCIPIFTGLIERLIRPFIISIFGNEGRLGSSNINRARGRTTLTVAALMVGISMVVGINGMTQSFEGDIQEWIDTALGGDLFVRSPLNIQPEMEARLLALPEITAVTKSRFAASQMLTPEGDDVFSLFVAIDPTTYLSVRGLRIQEGPEEAEAIRQLAAGDTILVSANVANRFNLNVNDIVLLDTKRGQRPFRIAAIVIDFGGGEQTAVTGSWQDLRRYFGINDISTIAVKLQPGTSLEPITDKIEDDVGASQNLAVESKAEFEQKIRDLSAQAFGLFDVLGLIGLVVAALGVINTMLMNVLERTRELGSLRSLGMTRPQVRRLILAEAAAIGFMGAIFGVAFGAVLSDVFIVGLRAIGGFVLNSQLPYGAMIYSFGLAFVVAIVAAFYPAYRASVINIITAIKHE